VCLTDKHYHCHQERMPNRGAKGHFHPLNVLARNAWTAEVSPEV
jgi:hypothetical protein